MAKRGRKPKSESQKNILFGNLFDIDSIEYSEKQYTGRTAVGLIHGHKYVVKLEQNIPYGYNVKIIYDATIQEDTDIVYRVSNEKSYNHFFRDK